MPNLILPDSAKRRRRTLPGSKLEVPRGVKLPTCMVPVQLEPNYKVCGAVFLPHQTADYERHVVSCSEIHEHLIRQLSPQESMPGVFGLESGDPEFENWVKRNAVGILTGRVKM